MTGTYFTRKSVAALNGLLVAVFAVFSLGNIESTQAQEIDVTHLYTDYEGFWDSGIGTINSKKPNNSHNLLGFTYDGIVYSTGVNDSILDGNSIKFVPMEFQAFPVKDISIVSNSKLSRFAQYGSLHNGDLEESPLDRAFLPVHLSDVLTDGIQGLDISSGFTNMSDDAGNPVEMEFLFTTMENPEEIGNNQPDILVSQIAGLVKGVYDEIWFADADGNLVGKKIVLNQFEDSEPLGKTMNDFFDPNTGKFKSIKYVNDERDIRLLAFEASEFGLNPSNFQKANKLIYKMGGKSDPAFLAFNTNLVKILVANDDQATVEANSKENMIPILKNDSDYEVGQAIASIFQKPANGTVEIVNGEAFYTPNEGFFGIDTFKYDICNTFGSTTGTCDRATVTVNVIAADVQIDIEIDNQFPNIGEEVTFFITVKNEGNAVARNVEVKSSNPDGFTIVRESRTKGNYDSNSKKWFIGSLKPGDSATFRLVSIVNPSGEKTHVVDVSTDTYDREGDNDRDHVTIGEFLSAKLVNTGCSSGGNNQGIAVELTGEGEKWELNYSIDGVDYIEEVDSASHLIDPKSKGEFVLKSIKDVYNEEQGEYQRELTFSGSNTTSFTIRACKIVTNPALLFKAKLR